MVYTPASWEKSTKSMIASSRGQSIVIMTFIKSFKDLRDLSQQLRSDLELLVRTACTDLIKRWKRTNADLREQQDLLRHSLASLQVHHQLSD